MQVGDPLPKCVYITLGLNNAPKGVGTLHLDLCFRRCINACFPQNGDLRIEHVFTEDRPPNRLTDRFEENER